MNRRSAVAVAVAALLTGCGPDLRVTLVAKEPDQLFAAIWASGAKDAWFGGNTNSTQTAVLVHFDGSSVSPVTLPGTLRTISGLWGSGPGDVWAAGAAPAPTGAQTLAVLLHYDGASWSTAFTLPGFGNFFGVWGAAAGDVWAVGNGGATADPSQWTGLLVHFDGTAWTSVPTPGLSIPGLRSICGRGPDDVWATGTAPIVNSGTYHWDGQSWSEPSQTVHARAFCSSDGLWLLRGESGAELEFYDEQNAPRAVDTGGRSVHTVFATSTADVWMAGSECARQGLLGCEQTQYVLAHSSGAAFTDVTLPSQLNTQEVDVIWGLGPQDVWFAGPFALLHHP